MKYLYHSLQLLLLVIVLMACKKLANDSLDIVPVLKAPLNISVINDDDQLPVVGAKVIISRKVSANGDFARIDTIRTDQKGQISLQVPYPNYLKVEIDTTYYHPSIQELQFTTENGGTAVLHTTPKFGMSPLDITITDSKDNLPIADFPLAISSKAPGQADYISTGSEHADANGKLIVSLPYPNEVKVAVGDTIKYFPDTVSASLKNVRGASVAIKAMVKPLTVPLEVTVIDKDNGAALANVSVAVKQRLTGQADFSDIGLTGVTDKDGKILFDAPFSGEVKILTTDELYNTPDSVITRMAYEKNRKVTLKSKALTPMAPVELSVYDQSNAQILPGISVKVSYKLTGQTEFTEVSTSTTGEDGKLLVSVPFSGEMKFDVTNDVYFGTKTMTVQNTGAAAKKVNLPLTLITAKYPEPILTGLQVSTLVLNNGVSLNKPTDVVADKRGNTYICDQMNNRIVRVSKSGNTTVLAGNATAGSTDGVGTSATFNKPWGLVLNDAGTILYVSDNSSHKIRKITINLTTMVGTVTTVAGGAASGTADGTGTAATFKQPAGLALDETLGLLYIADYGNSRIRKIDLSNNAVTTVSTSVVYAPVALALNPAKTLLYVGAFGNTYGSTGSQLIRFTPAGARTGLKGQIDDNYNNPSGLFISQAGKVFIANDQAHMISQLATEGAASGTGNGTSTFSYIAGSPTFTTTVTNGVTGTPGNVDGPAADARFTNPWGIKYNTYSGSFLIADQGNNSIRIMKSNTIN